MNKGKIKSYLVVLLSVLIVLPFFNAVNVNALDNVTLTLTKSSGTYKVGESFTVTINENSATEGINAVQADLTYDKNLLQFVSVDESGSAFSIAGPITSGGGVVNIPRATTGSLTGIKKVASVKFKVIATGDAKINFASSSAIVRTSDTTDIWNHAAFGGRYSLVSSSSTPSPSPSTNTPDEPAAEDKSNPDTKPGSAPAKVEPGAPKTSIKSETPPGAVVTQPSVRPGESLVAIKIVDKNSEPVEGATVQIDENHTAKTDKEGIASFTGVSEGLYNVNVTIDGKTDNYQINVKSAKTVNKDQPVQTFDLKLSRVVTPTDYAPLMYAGLALIIIIALIFLVRLRMSQMKLDKHNTHAPIQGVKPVNVAAPSQLVHPENQPVAPSANTQNSSTEQQTTEKQNVEKVSVPPTQSSNSSPNIIHPDKEPKD